MTPANPELRGKPLALPGVDSSVWFEKMSIISKISGQSDGKPP
jgi:hypothetical protein